jgi:putative restriction endonuclease
MREVAPGHIVFSFRDTVIAAIGIARSYCYESPKPAEFGAVGANWEAIGWKTDGSFRELKSLVRPKDYINRLKAFLPERYAPLRHTGDGLQSVYLTEEGKTRNGNLCPLRRMAAAQRVRRLPRSLI